MTEPDAAPTAADPSMDAPRRRPLLWLWAGVIVVALLTLAGWAGWQGWQQLQSHWQRNHDSVHALKQELQQTHSDLDTLRAKLGDADDAAQKSQQQIQVLQGRLQDLEHSVDSLGNTVRGGRQRVQLDVVEQLLLTANEAVQLDHAPSRARDALNAADARLSALDSPRLFQLRKVIANEQAALEQVREPDITALALKLDDVENAVATLPLAVQPSGAVGVAASGPASGKPSAAPSPHWWIRVGDRIGHALRALFHVRRTDQPIEPLLDAAHAPLVGEVMTLRLETARVALLERNTTLFHNAVGAARDWLHHYYRADDGRVQAGDATLATLAQVDLDPPLPDLSDSVELLRKLRDADTR